MPLHHLTNSRLSFALFVLGGGFFVTVLVIVLVALFVAPRTDYTEADLRPVDCIPSPLPDCVLSPYPGAALALRSHQD